MSAEPAILIMEPDDSQRILLRHLVNVHPKLRDLTALVNRSAQSALSLLKGSNYAIIGVVTELFSPSSATADELIDAARLLEIPVVIVTTQSHREAEYRNRGVSGFIHKPYHNADLTNLMVSVFLR